MENKDAKPRLICWVIILQEFIFEVKDCKVCDNQVAGHLSRLKGYGRPLGGVEIFDSFLDEHVLFIANNMTSWYVDLANYLTYNLAPDDLNYHQKNRFIHDVLKFYWDNPYIF